MNKEKELIWRPEMGVSRLRFLEKGPRIKAMQKMFLIIQRMVLVFGFLVSLAPYFACQQEPAPMKACSMCHMEHPMSCCHHSKPTDPLCQMVNQPAVTLSSVNPSIVATTVTAKRIFQPPFLSVFKAAPVVQVVESPPRSSPVLRI